MSEIKTAEERLPENYRESEFIRAQSNEISELRDRIKQLEQELADTKKSIKSVIQHYEDGVVYFERNYEAFYTDSFQDLMVDIYKKHDEAAKESSK